ATASAMPALSVVATRASSSEAPAGRGMELMKSPVGMRMDKGTRRESRRSAGLAQRALRKRAQRLQQILQQRALAGRDVQLGRHTGLQPQRGLLRQRLRIDLDGDFE